MIQKAHSSHWPPVSFLRLPAILDKLTFLRHFWYHSMPCGKGHSMSTSSMPQMIRWESWEQPCCLGPDLKCWGGMAQSLSPCLQELQPPCYQNLHQRCTTGHLLLSTSALKVSVACIAIQWALWKQTKTGQCFPMHSSNLSFLWSLLASWVSSAWQQGSVTSPILTSWCGQVPGTEGMLQNLSVVGKQ